MVCRDLLPRSTLGNGPKALGLVRPDEVLQASKTSRVHETARLSSWSARLDHADVQGRGDVHHSHWTWHGPPVAPVATGQTCRDVDPAVSGGAMA